MKKNLFLILITMLIGIGVGFSQTEFKTVPGTDPNNENNTRDVAANGLTSLYSISGNYYLSVDGAGNNSGPYTIDVNKPSPLATVHKAYLMDAVWSYTSANGCITLNGNSINWGGSLLNQAGGTNHWSDVTALVASVMDPASPGITSFNITECNYSSNEGTTLLVIFSDPTSPNETIVIMWGNLNSAGDNFAITLGEAIDPSDPGAKLDMGLGIAYSFQTGSAQNSNIDINGTRLTSSAGGQDDAPGSTGGNGQLITIGGIGDVNSNPPDPNHIESSNPRYDDELYSLLPLITNTTTNILVATSNPSYDDNIFVSYFEISGDAIIGEGILLTQTQNTENVNTNHTVTALVQDDDGAPVVGTQVDFSILSGPNSGGSFSGNTGPTGHISYTYLGSGGVGTDIIEACFLDSQTNTQCSNNLSVEWIDGGGPSVPVSDWAIYFAILLIGIAVWFRFKTRIA